MRGPGRPEGDGPEGLELKGSGRPQAKSAERLGSRASESRATPARRILIFVVGLAATLITLAAISGERGYRDVRRQRAQLSLLRAEVASLTRENVRLLDEVRALRKDPFVVEQIAREKLGYALPGEVVFQFPPEYPAVEEVPPPTVANP